MLYYLQRYRLGYRNKYKNKTNEVITKALKLLSEWEKGYQEWEQETREKLAVGLAQVEQGEVIDGDVVMARLHEKIRQARESQK
ncbi:type II toxin-antitoxin system ParD family antitoxin [Anabaena cylindrica FACHB-243]|nr:type II toxin-antitoxin system ParD family antitoxin [Anabaena cylindrica FACHB-243]MBY5284388.1 type II toxin-antitoxin system ParD family antitoxin [Anabaena sp. CCAP 1446/1C]MBY5306248.1 type II toxin-antitoxin system ParD family antitoxin [Anabaena sp. CCAP 1446/1C]